MNFKKIILIIIALFFMFFFRFLPLSIGLSESGLQVLGIFIGVLILWLNIAIDWPSILMLLALSFVKEFKLNSILSIAYGGSTFVFLMYTFVVTYALSKTTYIKRLALTFISSNMSKRGAWWFVSTYFFSIIFIGMFISPTVLFFVYLPILEEIYQLLDLKKGDKFAAMLMMGTVVMCGISSGMTPIAHVFPLIAMDLYASVYNSNISYLNYMLVAIPVGLITSLLTIFVFKYILKPNLIDISKIDFNKISIKEKPGLSEKYILGIFILVVGLWVGPSLLTIIFSNGLVYGGATYINSLGTTFPPLIATILLCLISVDNKPLLTINEAFSKGISWPSLIMCASTIALGSAITNTDIGITSWLSNLISPLIINLAPIYMVFLFSLWAALQTNFSSNMVTASLVSTSALAITKGIAGLNIPGLIINIGILSAYAFATPPAMPCVAIAGSSGWTTTSQMMKYGFIVMIISVLVASFIGYPIATYIF